MNPPSSPKSELIVDAWTADVGHTATTPEAFAQQVIERVHASWDQGADVVVLPEFLWLGLERFVGNLAELAELFWGRLWPELQSALTRNDRAVVLGTVPFSADDGLRNRAVIVSSGCLHAQDKICLTPWENAFTGGKSIAQWEFLGWRLATLICLDIEIPDHSVALRCEGLDLLLVPSATETTLGTERIARCASARSVEIGCYVIVSHLVGKCASELIDENLGRLSCYSPSQGAFREAVRVDEGLVHEDGWHQRRFTLSHRSLRVMRRNRVETNPSVVFPPPP